MIATIDDLEHEPDHGRGSRAHSQPGDVGLRAGDEQLAVRRDPAQQLGGDRRLAIDVPRSRSRSHRSAEATQSAALKYFKTSNRTVGLFMPGEPDRAEIPPRPDVTAMLQGYKGDEARAEGEAFDPTPANIESRIIARRSAGRHQARHAAEGDARRRRQRRDPPELRRREQLAGRGRLAGLTTQMLMRGTRNKSRQEIQDELARLQSQLNVGGGAGPRVGEHPEHAREPARRARARDRGAARARVPGSRARDAEGADHHEHRIVAQRAASHRLARIRAALGAQLSRATIRATSHRSTRSSRSSTASRSPICASFHEDFFGASHAEIVVDRRLRSRTRSARCSPSGSTTGAARSRSATC